MIFPGLMHGCVIGRTRGNFRGKSGNRESEKSETGGWPQKGTKGTKGADERGDGGKFQVPKGRFNHEIHINRSGEPLICQGNKRQGNLNSCQTLPGSAGSLDTDFTDFHGLGNLNSKLRLAARERKEHKDGIHLV